MLLLAHPRLASLAATNDISLNRGALRLHAPLGYADLVATIMRSAGVVTDSGGLQKEAFLLRIPTTTIRPDTEWLETLDLGWNVLANDSGDLEAAVMRRAPEPTTSLPYGDGHAAEIVVSLLLDGTS